jgi:hypothetical protein
VGEPHSAGHSVDLLSAIGGITLTLCELVLRTSKRRHGSRVMCYVLYVRNACVRGRKTRFHHMTAPVTTIAAGARPAAAHTNFVA